MQPPTVSFGTPLSALNNNEHEHSLSSTDGHQTMSNGPIGVHRSSTSPPKQQITLDPSTLKQQGGTSYANVKMMNANNLSDIQDKICSNNTTSNNGTTTTNNIPAPFTIQGFTDRYIPKNENHSEISC